MAPSDPTEHRDGREPRWGLGTGPTLIVAGLAVVVVGAAALFAFGGGRGGDGDQQVATDTTSSVDDTTGSDDTTDPTTTDDPDDDGTDGSTGDDDTGDDSDDPGPAAGRFRVATDLVAGDPSDPFLNLRAEPDAGAALVAKLPPTYSGLLATGASETAADGGTWLEVELLNPVALSAAAVEATEAGEDPRGWVNRAFIEPLPDGLAVGTDELAPCAAADTGAGVDGSLGAGHVQAIESAMLSPTCLRVVMTFGAGQAPVGWFAVPDDTAPTDAVPTLVTLSSGGFGTSIDLGPIEAAWSDATDTDDGVYLVRGDDGGLDLVSPTPADVVAMVARPDRGLVVVDLELGGQAPPTGPGVALTREPLTGAGLIEVVGLARPFEAVLGVTVEDSAGDEVEAVFSGNGQLGTRLGDGYGATTNDWLEAWGTFAVRVEGLAAGDYTVVLNPEDAADEPRVLRLPVRVDEGGEPPTLPSDEEQRVAASLLAAARSGDLAAVPLADEIVLALGPEPYRVATAAELAEPGAWAAGAPDGFAGFSGPFNPLDQLRRTSIRITAGPIPHCAGPAREWPSEFDGLRQVNIESIGIDSCIAWFGVHLFLDDEDRIAGVSLDLFGP